MVFVDKMDNIVLKFKLQFQLRTNYGPIFDQFWTKFLNQVWINFGPILAKFLDQFWTSFSLKQIVPICDQLFCSNLRPIFWTNLGPNFGELLHDKFLEKFCTTNFWTNFRTNFGPILINFGSIWDQFFVSIWHQILGPNFGATFHQNCWTNCAPKNLPTLQYLRKIW